MGTDDKQTRAGLDTKLMVLDNDLAFDDFDDTNTKAVNPVRL